MDFKAMGEQLLAAQRAADTVTGIDPAAGPDVTVYRCSCGFHTSDKATMLAHFDDQAKRENLVLFGYDIHDDPRR